MTRPNGKGRRPKTPRLKRGRAILREALESAVDNEAPSHSAAARWIDKDVSTLRRWLAGTHRMDAEAVLDSERLAPHFARCVAIVERKTRKVA